MTARQCSARTLRFFRSTLRSTATLITGNQNSVNDH